jgi:hypothetical protein
MVFTSALFLLIRSLILPRIALAAENLALLAGSFQSHKSAACIIITDEPHNVSDLVSTGMSINSMEGMSART